MRHSSVRSVIWRRTGDPSVLELVDRPVVEPGPGQVRVRVIVSGVNPADWKMRAGSRPGEPSPVAEFVPHLDGAGVVDAVGPGVDDYRRGYRVWMLMAAADPGAGTAQEYTVLPTTHVAPLPDWIDFETGASIGVPALTALRTLVLHEDGPAQLVPGSLAGRTVLVSGGAGAVGHAAVQLARWAGATVIATVSSDDRGRLAKRAGAQHVLDRRTTDIAVAVRALAPDGVDIVSEVAPAQNLATDLAVLAQRGVVVAYANEGGREIRFPVLAGMGRNARLQFVSGQTAPEDVLHALVTGIAAPLADGVLAVGTDAGLPITRFTLDRIKDAHAAGEAGTTGKILVDVSPS